MVNKELNNKILYVEACDFRSFPLGGTLSFSKQFIKNVNYDMALVGLGNSKENIGIWTDIELEGKKFKFYSIGTINQVKNSKLPKRIVTYLMLRKHVKTLSQNKHNILFTQTPQFVFLAHKLSYSRFSFCFAGLGNSVGLSRFKVLRVFGGLYEKMLFNRLNKYCDLILAAADKSEIDKKERKYNLNKKIISFPTRFNNLIFFPEEKLKSRKEFNLDSDRKIIITTGRLAEIKGWKDLIDSFRIARLKEPKLVLFFIGEGEDRERIESYASDEIQKRVIILLGRKSHSEISKYLNASDLFVMTSYVEGWPTSMVEALACGKNIVTSNIGGANDMVKEGKNGFIIKDRSPYNFSNAILKALDLPNPNSLSLDLSSKYSSCNLDSDFKKIINGISN